MAWNVQDLIPVSDDWKHPVDLPSDLKVDLTDFVPAAVMTLSKDGIQVLALNVNDTMRPECVYIWLTPNGDPIRAGTSQAPLWKRLRSYPR